VQARVFGGLRVGGLTDAEVGSRKARTLLAVLLLVLVSRLRRLHGPDAVQRIGEGYAAGLLATDLIEFEARAADAQARLAAGEVGAALASARAALELFDAGPLLGAETGTGWRPSAPPWPAGWPGCSWWRPPARWPSGTRWPRSVPPSRHWTMIRTTSRCPACPDPAR